jgi:hypothetical protein
MDKRTSLFNWTFSDGKKGFITSTSGSRLKQNIDELDTLLSDLNNARGNSYGDSQHQGPML